MNVAAGPELAAAVSNEGGLGVIGGLGYTPEMLREQCKKIKEGLKDKAAPWGVDLLLPQVGGSARKTNKDYTGGALFELLDIIIEEGASLFVSAVGVPPVAACEKLHAVRQPTRPPAAGRVLPINPQKLRNIARNMRSNLFVVACPPQAFVENHRHSRYDFTHSFHHI